MSNYGVADLVGLVAWDESPVRSVLGELLTNAFLFGLGETDLFPVAHLWVTDEF